MSTGAAIALGFVLGVVLTSAVFISARRRLQPPPVVVGEVSEDSIPRQPKDDGFGHFGSGS